MLKKLCSIALSFLIVLSFSACAGNSSLKDDENQQVKLLWTTTTIGQTDSEVVFKAFNKKLEKLLPNTTVEFKELNTDNWTRWMAAKEPIDITWTGYSFDMASEISAGAYMDITDLVETYGENIKKEMEEYKHDYLSGMIDDKLYAIPNQQPIIQQSSVVRIPADNLQYFDVDRMQKESFANPHTTREMFEVLDDYLQKVFEAGAYNNDKVGANMDFGYYDSFVFRGYDNVGSNLVYDAFDDSGKILNKYETEEFKLFIEYSAKWYDAGYITSDIRVAGTGNGSRAAIFDYNNSAGLWYDLYDEKGIQKTDDKYGVTLTYSVLLDNYDNVYNGVSKIGSESTYLAIPFTSKNPARAIKLLDLLRSPVGTEGNELLNLLVYGFEENSKEAEEYGTYHYTLDGDCAYGVDYTIQPDMSSLYGIPHWEVGNVFKTYRTPNIKDGQIEFVKNYETVVRPELHKTVYYQKRFDLNDYSIEVANVKSANSEYLPQLNYGTAGTAGYEAIYNEFIAKLNSVGISKMIDGLQEQGDSYK